MGSGGALVTFGCVKTTSVRVTGLVWTPSRYFCVCSLSNLTLPRSSSLDLSISLVVGDLLRGGRGKATVLGFRLFKAHWEDGEVWSHRCRGASELSPPIRDSVDFSNISFRASSSENEKSLEISTGTGLDLSGLLKGELTSGALVRGRVPKDFVGDWLLVGDGCLSGDLKGALTDCLWLFSWIKGP